MSDAVLTKAKTCLSLLVSVVHLSVAVALVCVSLLQFCRMCLYPK